MTEAHLPQTSPGANVGASQPAGVVRRLVWLLPEPLKRGLLNAYHIVRPPPSEKIVFPPDVADKKTLQRRLLDTDVFGTASEEGTGYLWHALERFRVTLAITPDLPTGAKILELGANPYFFTRMLLGRGLNVTCANWFGYGSDVGMKGSDVITSPRTGERLVIDYDHFDIEVDRFPYDDDTFDVVFFCEILEHLPLDPVHALVEIHRVLKKPDGLLVLSTPNPVRAENLTKMIRGENIYEPLSGYGIHGRHNREYTVAELRILLDELGYELIRIFTANISPGAPDAPRWRPGLDVADRGEYVFLLASAFGRERWRFPEWLYQSRHALRRVVMADMDVGRNDDVQTVGFHDRETVGGRDIRWIGRQPEARVLLSPQFRGPGLLRIDGLQPPPEVGEPIRLLIGFGEEAFEREVESEGDWFVMNIPVEVTPENHLIRLRVSRTWIPADLGMNDDRRELGLAISQVGFVPVGD